MSLIQLIPNIHNKTSLKFDDENKLKIKGLTRTPLKQNCEMAAHI